MKQFVCAVLLCIFLALPVHATEDTRYIALTFDDGPSGRFTSRLLDGLAERDVPATFFLCGYRVDQYPKLTARIAQDGHEIGTHGYAHKFFSEMSAQDVQRDLAAAQESILAASGQEPTLLRPPGGIFCKKTLQTSVCAGMPVILWSIDPEDWRRTDSDAITAQIVREAENGDIILMHDMSDSSVDAALKVIDELRGQGFVFVTVSELARLSGTELCACEPFYQFRFPAKKSESSASVAFTEP